MTPGLSRDDCTALVTGANDGIGYCTAEHLAALGVRVLLGCRRPERGVAAAARIRGNVAAARVEPIALDLADLGSIESATDNIRGWFDRLDLLINNAGVMALRRRQTTQQGFELQFGTNHLGHYALTARLLPLLARQPGSRVVTVTALRYRGATIDFDDLMGERAYDPWKAYAQSKLANVLFALELDRRLRSASATTLSVAAHPGLAVTNLFLNGPARDAPPLLRHVLRVVNRLIAQPARRAAAPTILAATSADVRSGEFYGPGGLLELRGRPARAKLTERALDAGLARRLCQVSQDLTGVTLPLPVGD